tara:strand:- start:1183 stop:1755 length:573 start_codon:yes stop_codon:yes gene_type:complete
MVFIMEQNMQKVFINIITQTILILTFITIISFSSDVLSDHTNNSVPPTSLMKNSPLLLHDVYTVCNDSLNGDDPEYRELARALCDFYLRAINESFYYHRSFTEFFKREGDEEADYIVELANIYNPFGCDIKELDNDKFIELIIRYSDKHPDELEDSFYFTLRKITEPYCIEMINKKTEYYLDEYDGRRKS